MNLYNTIVILAYGCAILMCLGAYLFGNEIISERAANAMFPVVLFGFIISLLAYDHG